MPDIHLLRPFWLLALVPILLIAVVAWRRRSGDSVWGGLVDAHLLPHLLVGETSGAGRRLPLLLFTLASALVVLALAGPVWERLPQPVFTTAAQRIILLDLSPTMNAADLAPSRLARARFEIQDLLKASKEGQVGLIAFGSEPFVVSPLTTDARTIAAQVPQLSTDLIPVPGPRRTDLALKLAGEMLDRAKSNGGTLILVTDDVGSMAGALEQAHALASKGRHLSVLAVGTAKGAPVPDPQGGFLKASDGRILMARLDSQRLKELARAGAGRFLVAKVGEGDTAALVDSTSALNATVEKTDLIADRWREEGPWLLLLVLPLAALAFRRGWLLPALMLVCFLPPQPSYAFGWSDLWARPDQQAAHRLDAGDAAGAAERFSDPSWRAAAHYRAGHYDQSLESLANLQGPEADYNRGNALARLGRLDEAVKSYEHALKQNPDHADAKHNLELVKQLLKQRQDQDSSQQDSQQKQDQSQQDPSQKGDSKQGSESAGDQGGEDAQDQSQSNQSGSGESGADQNSGQNQDKAPDGSDGQSGSQAQNQESSKASGQTPQTSNAGEPSDQSSQESEAGQSSKGSESNSDTSAADGDQSQGADRSAGSKPSAEDFSKDALGASSDESADSDRDSDANAAIQRRLHAAQSDPDSEQDASKSGSGLDDLTPAERERQQAMEAQLRSVPDDPAGLLRQRFLLQHLRREGRLP
ncbi:Tetratricopeptide TPR_1 repeat-containing protein [Thiorhodococcus drewsii AZ1]|uniref:Tetratricopeptide TPR_1 repeat-containing protein n=1 Tax=Thiorhodococcus drewsii AZ1 TaxID=765913 RepID=G2DWL7_9GAMM|nr:VWA domain-containing protein [Thiorhodococcus drewsii]EGV33717.1 Tetratricopeptide TPR_1 repeat-containing protein [Thiorhodococcus drewsii AZ1]